MCTPEEKGELEQLKAWQQDATKALAALQAQVKSLCNEVELINNKLEAKEDELKALRRILGINQSDLYPTNC